MSTVPAPPASPYPSPAGPRPPDDLAINDFPRWVRPALLVNLIAQIGIVLTGGLVRLTGSGLGCPTWPECVPGSFTPVPHQAESYHKYIEFGNRLLTFVVALAAIAALAAVLAYRRRNPTGRRFLLLGLAPLLLVIAQAVIGGVTVLTGLSPITVATHFLVSMVLVAVSGLAYLATGAPVPANGRVELRWITAGITVAAVVVLVLGTVTTGAGPHSGDADTPARFGFDPAGVARLHAVTVWLFVGLVVALALGARLTEAHAVLRRRTLWLLGVTVAQSVIGYVQYFTDLPIVLVALHMVGASLLTLVVTAVVAAVIGTRGILGTTREP